MLVGFVLGWARLCESKCKTTEQMVTGGCNAVWGPCGKRSSALVQCSCCEAATVSVHSTRAGWRHCCCCCPAVRAASRLLCAGSAQNSRRFCSGPARVTAACGGQVGQGGGQSFQDGFMPVRWDRRDAKLPDGSIPPPPAQKRTAERMGGGARCYRACSHLLLPPPPPPLPARPPAHIRPAPPSKLAPTHLHEVAQHGYHGQAAVLDLPHLLVHVAPRPSADLQRVKGQAACRVRV